MPLENGVLLASLKLRGDTAAALSAENRELLERELCVETDTYTTVGGKRVYKCKVGPGTWNALPYAALGDAGPTESDVAAMIAAHASAADPHGDRAYTDGKVAAEVTARNTAIAQALVGLWNDRGNYDASAGGAFPANGSGPGGAVRKGDIWTVSVAGTVGTEPVDQYDTVRALVDDPADQSDWAVGEGNVQQATESQRGTAKVAAQATVENDATPNDADLVTPKKWWQAWTKGLTLSAFGSAVRGMLLTGYTVGANAAVAATDTIMGAVGKLQGQVNARLSKSSNLSDLSNPSFARDNLGLGDLAVEDAAYSTEIRFPYGGLHTVEDTIPSWIAPSQIPFLALDFEPAVPSWDPGDAPVNGKWVLAHSGRNGGRVMGIAYDLGNFSSGSLNATHIFTSGEFDIPVGAAPVDPTGGLDKVIWCLTNKPGLLLPSNYSGTSPAGGGTVINKAIPVLVTTPGPTMSGYDMRCQILNTVGGPVTGPRSITMATGQTVNDSAGAAIKELSLSVSPGVYEIRLYAQVIADLKPSIGIRADDGITIGTALQCVSANTTIPRTLATNGAPTSLDGSDPDGETPYPYTVSATVIVGEHGSTIDVMLSSYYTSSYAKIEKSSVLVWEKVG